MGPKATASSIEPGYRVQLAGHVQNTLNTHTHFKVWGGAHRAAYYFTDKDGHLESRVDSVIQSPTETHGRGRQSGAGWWFRGSREPRDSQASVRCKSSRSEVLSWESVRGQWGRTLTTGRELSVGV